jgi:aspartate-semialdehyde dehydrogenase
MSLPPEPNIAIVGATGAVGEEFLSLIASRRLPHGELRLLCSPRSAGKQLPCGAKTLTTTALTPESFEGIDLAFFSAGGSVSREFAPIAVRSGAWVVDNSSAFRMDDASPLIVPEVNGDVLDDLSDAPRIIANPNCSTIIALMAVSPLHRAVGVERMVVSTYQAASGAGAAMMAELEQQAHDYVHGRAYTTNVIGRQYMFNLFSHDSTVGPDGYNEEETKMVRETHKIWGDDRTRITATCVRVPILRAHCESINLTFRAPLSESDARVILAEADGVAIVDDRDANAFPEPIHASGQDDVLVGRIRADRSQPADMGIDLFVAGDQLRKGAALNAVQIAERLWSRACVSP